MNPDYEDLMQKYKKKLSEQLDIKPEKLTKPVISREYKEFKKQYLPRNLSWYEKACNYSENLLKIGTDKKKEPLLREAIEVCHLNVTPNGITSFSILAPILIILIGSVFSFILFQSLFFVMFFLLVGAILIAPLSRLPFILANNWRMKSSNQMVLCIFYIVTYMRHTSNIEHAIAFASEHISPPLSLDLKKILWDVEIEKYESVKESLDLYLETWRKYNNEFIESFHLIESSLYEPSEDRRLDLLDKSLSVILDETYEKMLHYAHNLKSPITMLHMLGIILPILGLVILPLIINFLGNVQWYHIAMLYNVTLPITVYFIGKSILSKRPTGYGDTDISKENPELKKYKSIIINLMGYELKITPLIISIFAFFILFIIGISPVLLHTINPTFDIGFGAENEKTVCGRNFCFIDYQCPKEIPNCLPNEQMGPYGLGASIISIFIILAIGLSIGLYYSLRSKNIIKIREKTKKLEDEFASALFQLGNRLGDGLPPEIAFSKVSQTMPDSVSGKFFAIVNQNITRLGMSVKKAIFDIKSGAIVYFPSRIIESSMKVLIQSAKKGPKIAAQALTNVARYIKEIHKVNERLRDLMADVISSMKSQIKFLTPVIAGIVIGITSMVTTILGKLSTQLTSLQAQGTATAAQTNIADLFGRGIPTYYFQIIVGIYVIQIVYILTILSNGIENGADKLNEGYELGKNLTNSTLMYAITSIIVMLLFNLIAAQIMSTTLTV